MVTLKTIAKQAGVSATTVSRVLNAADDSDSKASYETIQKIKKIASDLNYVPNRIARVMKNRVSQCIGVVAPTISDPFFYELYDQIRIYLLTKGYQTVLFYHDTSEDYKESVEKSELIDRLNNWYTDAFIFTYPDNHGIIEEVSRTYGNSHPFVILDYDKPQEEAPRLNRVVVNIMDSVEKLLRYLISNRMYDIVYLGFEFDPQDSRLRAFQKVMSESGHSLNNEIFIGCGPDLDDGYNVVERMIQNRRIPQALFCVNDSVAMGAMQCLHTNGYHIPDDISIIGTNDIKLARYAYPSLTTIRLPIRKIAESLSNIVLSEIKTKSEKHTGIYLNTELVIRNSTI